MVQLLEIVENDARTVTGSNLRSVMLQSGLNSLKDLSIDKICNFDYTVEEDQVWTIDFARELIELRYTENEVPGFENQELEDILEHLCTS